MYKIQINLTGQINAFDSKIDSKIDAFRSEMRTSLPELTAELKQQENQLVWRVFFAASVVLIFTIPSNGGIRPMVIDKS
jgi:hypothetical protein